MFSISKKIKNCSIDNDLGAQSKGFEGRVVEIDTSTLRSGLGCDEIERRIIEHGFVEGAHIKILHEGLFGRDPIAVRIERSTVALRRDEARAIIVEPLDQRKMDKTV